MALKAKTTQEFVPIKEIRDGIIVLKDGGMRAIVLANSVNLSLKSDEEQRATIFQFQGFLNTLDFPIQISVQSRRLNIKPYIATLENRMRVQNEPLLKIQTKEYIDFIRTFTEQVSIMTKNFFIIVSYSDTSIMPKGNFLEELFAKKSKEELRKKEELDFEEKRSQLEERVSVIRQGLSRCGIQSAQLGTEEAIEVFYKVFNPGETEGKINTSNI
ncbi:MAG: hypothetical protein K9L98_00065 [Candidatus Pacebacteria bacterium]|nr:hypothetical protein [Candidatus Paceibacterota bacterium]MCF7862398.1 hypothetical protein [Candidatus Paceibacterota bacterium]